MNDKYVKLADVKRKLRYIFKVYGVGGFVREKVERALNNLPYSVKGDLETTLEASDVQPVDRWISVKDRLPEKEGDVLVWIVNGKPDGIHLVESYYMAYWEEGNFYDSDYNVVNGITYWQPLPEPPKEG